MLNRDHAYSPAIGRKTNVYYALENKLSGDLMVAMSSEKERGGGTEAEHGVKMRYLGFGDSKIFSSWKRSLRATGPSSTTRFDFSRPFFDGNGKFLYSFTRRKTWSKRTNSSTFRLSNRYGLGISAGISYSYSENTPSRFDTNLSWKF